MALGLSRREHWALIGVVGVILVGITIKSLHSDSPSGDIGIDATGRWEKIVAYQAGQRPQLPATSAPTSQTHGQTPPLKSGAIGATNPAANPKAETGGIDINRANAEEFDRLPGIGPVRARDIIATRTRLNGFHKIEDLRQVKGIGPATLEKLRPYVFVASSGDAVTTQSLATPPSTASTPAALGGNIAPRTPSNPTSPALALIAPAPPINSLPASPASKSRGTSRTRPAATPRPIVNINRAGLADLAQIDGIGPALAERIVQDRAQHGPYRTPYDLERVRGIGRENIIKMLPQIAVN